MEPDASIAMDRELIDRLGGPAKVAELLGFDKKGGAQRVHNWKERGIPPAIKLAYPDVFLNQTKPDEPVVIVAPGLLPNGVKH
ncbi:hypothetical protein Tamer19_17520 [Cupriavidus sp. TA19]|uniref:hypothetical protein n=1 Tax=Cupriavidus sp. TA19 TaxID=701108 RepID=UPI0027294E12|nr:hypothetical protein [Cupriavidus sp. TA19]GLC92344.1 hypothetical protein Tamer19_17520 [Cupriavidus sp. TA19]